MLVEPLSAGAHSDHVTEQFSKFKLYITNVGTDPVYFYYMNRNFSMKFVLCTIPYRGTVRSAVSQLSNSRP
jgi:hypothetical protein